MATSHDILRERLLKKAGLGPPPPKPMSLEELEAHQWSPVFERYMKNRLIMGGLRYGLHNAPGKKPYDRVASIKKRVDKYQATGNLEHLVDAANECLCEFVEERFPHPNRHFAAQDDSEHTSTR